MIYNRNILNFNVNTSITVVLKNLLRNLQKQSLFYKIIQSKYLIGIKNFIYSDIFRTIFMFR